MADIRMKYANKLKGGSENPDVRYLAEARALQDEYFDMEWGNNDDDPNDDILRARTIAIIERLEHIFYHIVLSPHVADEIEEIIQNVANDWADDNDTNVIEGGMMEGFDDEGFNMFINELDEMVEELRSIELPLTRPNRIYITEMLNTLEGLLDLVNGGAEPFNNEQHQLFFQNKIQHIIEMVKSYLSFSIPQPRRPFTPRIIKPRRTG